MDVLAAVVKQSFVWYSQPLKAELGWRKDGEEWERVGQAEYKGRRAPLSVASFLAGLACQWAELAVT